MMRSKVCCSRPHLTTFDGLHYNFQTIGEFVLTRQVSGGNFEVQARLSPPGSVAGWSTISEIGVQVGADRVTIEGVVRRAGVG